VVAEQAQARRPAPPLVLRRELQVPQRTAGGSVGLGDVDERAPRGDQPGEDRHERPEPGDAIGQEVLHEAPEHGQCGGLGAVADAVAPVGVERGQLQPFRRQGGVVAGLEVAHEVGVGRRVADADGQLAGTQRVVPAQPAELGGAPMLLVERHLAGHLRAGGPREASGVEFVAQHTEGGHVEPG